MADVDLTLILKNQADMQNDIRTLKDAVNVLTGMMIRFEGALQGLVVEVRALHSWLSRTDDRLRKLEGADHAHL